LGDKKSAWLLSNSVGNVNFKAMKPRCLLLILLLPFGTAGLSAQSAAHAAPTVNASHALPSVLVKDMAGHAVSTADFENDGRPIILSFWATWCKPCILELNTIQEEFEGLAEETGVKLIAVSIDDARNANKVAPFVQGRDWPYEVYIDENSDLKRAMSVNNVPHTFLLDGTREIVWNHNSFTPGDEEELFDLVRKLAKTGSSEEH
jgi:cytochrome c biogenesis protein CcmG, thiol:disulfide interchange protein DsbE